MISFEISKNGQRLYTAGIGNHGVLSAIVTWTLRDSASIAAHPVEVREEAAREELRIEVGGLASAVHHHWPAATLRAGDEVLVRICETDIVDPPSDSSKNDPERKLASEQEYVRRRCEKWGWQITEPETPPEKR